MATSKRQKAKRSAMAKKAELIYTTARLKGCSPEQALSVLDKALGTKAKKLLSAKRKTEIIKAKHMPRKIMEGAPRLSRRGGGLTLSRRGYRLPENATLDQLGNLDQMIPVSNLQAFTPWELDLSRSEDRRKAKQYAEKIERIQSGPVDWSQMDMALSLAILEIWEKHGIK